MSEGEGEGCLPACMMGLIAVSMILIIAVLIPIGPERLEGTVVDKFVGGNSFMLLLRKDDGIVEMFNVRPHKEGHSMKYHMQYGKDAKPGMRVTGQVMRGTPRVMVILEMSGE